ncbi:amino acid ABC transporter permease [Rothia sp. P6271]|uniref:amino acid ABC transporter permease n=1 Tax=Rothia sp. P6271 TaxID=3402659 RepID=UPI003AC6A019
MKTQQTTSVLFDTPGPRGRALTRAFNIIAIIALLAFFGYVLMVMNRQGQLEAEKWTELFTYRAWESYFIPGIISTLKAAFIAVITSVIFGMIFGYMRLAQNAFVRAIGTVVVEFFRAVPVLIMMIFFWLFLGRFSVFSPSELPFIAVVLGLTLYNGSVIAELLRSGVKQLPKGQGEAGVAIGLTPGQVLRNILMPQAMLTMMPSLLSQFVVILKDTALGYIISYPELLAAARRFGSGEGNILQSLLLAAVLFIIINFALTIFASWLSGFLSSRSSSGIKKSDGVPGEVDNPNPDTIQMFKMPKA